MIKAVILDDYQQVALTMADWSPVKGRCNVTVQSTHIEDREALAQRLAGAEIVVGMRERTVFDADMLRRLPDLRLLITTGMKNASFDMAAAAAQGVTVCGTPGGGPAAAELTFGLILALARHIPAEAAGLAAGDPVWQRTVGMELNGRRIGILGFGRLGKLLARYSIAFGMEPVVWSRSLTEEQAAAHGVTRAATLPDALAAGDIATIHLPLNAQTRGLIGAEELAAMRPGALLINTSRGPIVDEGALIVALKSGHLGGAGLDVFDVEPLPTGHPLRGMANVLATPHLGYVTDSAYGNFFPGAVEAIAAWLDGTPIRVLNGA